MFRPTTAQRSLFEWEFLLPATKVARLQRSWAHFFREVVLPLIDEEVFRDAFSQTTGRPNRSIRLLVGLHLLKDWNDLTDEQALEQLEFNLQWHYALGIEADEAHTCQKTLHNFRAKLMDSGRAQEEFRRVTQGLAEADGLDLKRQRLDSTHVLSNIAVLRRLSLFVETVTHFLKALRRQDPEAYESLPVGFRRRYVEREGYFSDAKKDEARRRLPVVARDVYELVTRFEFDATVRNSEEFGLLVRLFEEQCEVVEDADQGDDDGKAGGGRDDDETRIRVADPKTVQSDSLQSPHDPDATYGHKGKGYEVQVAETCSDDNPYQIITATSVNGAHESDQQAVVPMLDQLEESQMLPDELQADTGYGSGANLVESAERGVELLAPVQDPSARPRTDHFAAAVVDETPEESAAVGDQASVAEEPLPLGLWAFVFAATFDQVVQCPASHAPKSQQLAGGQLNVVFACEHCLGCPLAGRCPTRLLANGDRKLRRAPATIATEIRQHEQQQPAFKERYRKRSGIESTNQEMKGRHGLGDLRVRGRPRVELAATLKALALNTKRAVQWHVSQLAQSVSCTCAA